MGKEKIRALVVDDSRAARVMLGGFLGDICHCTEAVDGREAVDAVVAALGKDQPFELIVMDIMMPVMDGHHALERIRALEHEAGLDRDKRAKVIMLSCLDDAESVLRSGFESGAEIYLTKPLSLSVLWESLINLGLVESPVEFED